MTTEQDFDPQEELDDSERGKQLEREAKQEENDWRYGHSQGILDAISILLSNRDHLEPFVMLSLIESISRQRLFDRDY